MLLLPYNIFQKFKLYIKCLQKKKIRYKIVKMYKKTKRILIKYIHIFSMWNIQYKLQSIYTKIKELKIAQTNILYKYNRNIYVHKNPLGFKKN